MSQPLYRPSYNRSYALVIGIDRYTADLPTLQTAVLGAQAVADLLKQRYGFEVRCLLDEQATWQAIRESFDELCAVAEPDDRLVIYFAGHGVGIRGAVYTEGRLVAHDSEPGRRRRLIPMSELANFNAVQAKHALVILDCCYSGLVLQTNRLEHASLDPFQEAQMRGVEPLSIPTGGSLDPRRVAAGFLSRRACQIMTSSNPFEQATDAALIDGHTPFTGFLLRALRGQESTARDTATGLLTANSVASFVKTHMTHHFPHLQASQISLLPGDAGGQFLWEQPGLFGWLPDERLRYALTHPDAHTRYYALEAAHAYLDDPRYAAAMRSDLADMLIHDPNEEVRHRIFTILQQHPGPGSQLPSSDHHAGQTPPSPLSFPPPGWTRIFYDSFSHAHNPNWWPLGEHRTNMFYGSWKIHQGRYYWEAHTEYDIPFWEAYPQMPDVKDLYAAVEARRMIGSHNAEYGLMFRYINDLNCYTFSINDNGRFIARLRCQGHLNTLLTGYTPATRAVELKHLAICAVGQHLTFLVNNQIVGEIDDTCLSIGKAGLAIYLYGNDTAMFEFDSFELYVP